VIIVFGTVPTTLNLRAVSHDLRAARHPYGGWTGGRISDPYIPNPNNDSILHALKIALVPGERTPNGDARV
jgi:hypothetical protein